MPPPLCTQLSAQLHFREMPIELLEKVVKSKRSKITELRTFLNILSVLGILEDTD